LFCIPFSAAAVTMQHDYFQVGNDIVVSTVDGGGRVYFYDTDSGNFVNMIYVMDGGSMISLADTIGWDNVSGFVPGHYAAIETMNWNCDQFDYQGCQNADGFQGEADFTMGTDPASYSTEGTKEGGTIVYPPIVNISGLTKGAFPHPLSGVFPIPYVASDKDDALKDFKHGLAANPVDVFYSPPFSFDWKSLATGLPATGTFMFDTTRLPESDRYRLKFLVHGVDGDETETVVNFVAIDNTPPSFAVHFQPAFTRGEPVTLSIESTKPLASLPTTTIRQLGQDPVAIKLTGNVPGQLFSGTFTPRAGFDGPAEVRVLGADLAGNNGTVITEGDHLMVGVAPPSRPTLSPVPDRLDQSVLPQLIGTVGPTAVEVGLRVNGTSSPIRGAVQKGQFEFRNVPLQKDFNHGHNALSVVAWDIKGAPSEAAQAVVTVNSPPVVTLINPLSGGRRNGQITFAWSASDPNGDQLTAHVELSDDKGTTWQTLASGLTSESYDWDSSAVPDQEEYLARVVVSDGLLTTASAPARFTLANDLPIISLDSKGDIFVSGGRQEITGSVRNMNDPLMNVEYALDGQHWQSISPTEGAWGDKALQKFRFALSGLGSNAAQSLVLRGKTRSGKMIVSAQHISIGFDTEPPQISLEGAGERISRERAVTVLGVASDKGAAGLSAVRYKVDDSSWYEAPFAGVPGAHAAAFAVHHPQDLPDGSHRITVQAVDRAGNISPEVSQVVIVKATPPQIGAFAVSADGQAIYPDAGGNFLVPAGTTVHVRMRITGQPTFAVLDLGGQKTDLAFDEKADLWSADVLFVANGAKTLAAQAGDEDGNEMVRPIGVLTPAAQTAPTPVAPLSWWQRIFSFQ